MYVVLNCPGLIIVRANDFDRERNPQKTRLSLCQYVTSSTKDVYK